MTDDSKPELDLRALLRQATVGESSAELDRKIVTIGPGREVEVRQTTVARRARIVAQMEKAKEAEDKIRILQVAALTECCYVPHTNDKLFGPGDADAIANARTNGWADMLLEAAKDMLNLSGLQGKD